jgi:paraquat-inducible protein A
MGPFLKIPSGRKRNRPFRHGSAWKIAPATFPTELSMSSPLDRVLTCQFCGLHHHAVTLSQGETARCVRCDSTLAAHSRLGTSAPKAFAFAGIAFAVPAALLPFITVEKLGNMRTGGFLSSVIGLYDHDMPLLAAWVLLCGGIIPLFLLISLVFVRSRTPLSQLITRALPPWVMPEVFVLAVLISLTRLGSVVDVELNAGFWSYVVMSLALSLAWRAHRLQSTHIPPA